MVTIIGILRRSLCWLLLLSLLMLLRIVVVVVVVVVLLVAVALACGVALPQNTPEHCRAERTEDLAKMKSTYKLGHVKKLPFPLLMIEPMQLVSIYYSDPFTKPWMELYIYMLRKNLALIQEFPKTNAKEFTSFADYKKLVEFFIAQQQNNPQVGPVDAMHPWFKSRTQSFY